MLQNKKVNILISVVAAICLWAYVTGSIDPNITKKFTSVPVKLINQDSLIQDGLAVEEATPLTLDVTVVGTRAQVNKITNDDIIVTADLYGRNKGTNYVSLDVQLPKGMSVDSKSQDRIEVKVDDLFSEEKEIKAVVNGTLPENTALGETTIDPEKLIIYGTENNVKKVDYVKATLNADDLSEKRTTNIVGTSPVDGDGNAVNFVSTSRSTVTVKAVLAKYKEVKLSVKTVGEIDSKYEVDSINIPQTVQIVGDADVLANIDSITATDVDISGVTKSTNIKVIPILPSGVKLKDGSEDIYVNVVIKGAEKKTLVFPGKEIEVRNLDDGLTATIQGSVSVDVSGKKSIISIFQKKDITLYVNAANLGEGEYELEVFVVNDNQDISVTHTPAKIKVIVSKE